MASRTTGSMVTLHDDEEKFDVERFGKKFRVTEFFVDEQNQEIVLRGTNHFWGGRHEQLRLSYRTGGPRAHYAEVITDPEALQLIEDELAQALVA